MTDTRIATSAEQPIHSDGAPANEVIEEAQLVGLNDDGELVLADAAAGTQIKAVGVAAVPVDDHSTYPTGQFEHAAKAGEANRLDINGNKAGYVKYGVEIVNEDADWGWDPGEPVYLASSDDSGFSAGDFTETAPSATNEYEQVVGEVQPDGESIILNVHPDYTQVA